MKEKSLEEIHTELIKIRHTVDKVIDIGKYLNVGGTATSAAGGTVGGIFWIRRAITILGGGTSGACINRGLCVFGKVLIGSGTMMGGIMASAVVSGGFTIIAGLLFYFSKKQIFKMILNYQYNTVFDINENLELIEIINNRIVYDKCIRLCEKIHDKINAVT